jgi:PAS domain S-box-containing protein
MNAVATILVVEDNPTTRKMLRLALVTEGYAVMEAPDGRAALLAAANTPPDLVLQDLILPDMDGLELLRRLRALPGGTELPILALSGFLSRLKEAQSDKLGFTALLVKPIEPSRLIEALRVYLPGQSAGPRSHGEGRRLLVVDDDQVQLKLTRVHFSQLGFDVTAVSSASDAVVAARSHRPDAILSDVFMPGTDGFDLCLEIRSDPDLANVPVLLLSGQYGSKADEDLARRVGASALVLRTPDFRNVAPAILQALETCAPAPAEQPSDQLALRHARLVIHQLERQAAASAGLVQRSGIQASQLSLLSGVANALTRKADPDLALRDVLAATLDAAGISKGALMLRDATGVLALRQAIGFSETERSKLQTFFGHAALLEDIVDRGGSVAVPSAAIPDATSRDILAAANISAAQIVPLISDGHGLGAMIIGTASKDVTSEDSVAFARAMGNQIVQSLELASSMARLTVSEQRYRTLLENASDFIAVLSPDGVVREVNHRWVELTGIPQGQLIGRNIREFAPLGYVDETARTRSEAVSTSVVHTPPIEIARPDGSSAFIEFSSTNVDVGGERLVLTIGRDVTERKRGEEVMREAGRQKDEFLAMLAHELRNPLAPIQSAVKLLEHQAGAGDGAIRVIERQVAQLVRLVDDLLDVSRTTLNKIHLRTRPVTLEKILEDAVETVRPLAVAAGHSLDIRRPATPVWLIADSARLVQVFSNLINNAIKFTRPNGHVSVSVEQNDHTATIRVVDNGIGFTKEFQQHIFEMYSQEDNRLERAAGGLGVGLALAKAVVVMHGGRIEAMSGGRDLGAEFAVTLPVVSPVHDSESQMAEAAAPETAGRPLRVLVVDDNADGANMLRAFVNTMGHETAIAFDGPSGLAQAKAFQPDLILLDIGLPGMNGYEVARSVRQEGALSDVYLAAVTGWGTEEDKSRAREAGFDIHLTKPPDLDAIESLTATLAHTVNCRGCVRCLRTEGTPR